MSPYSSPMRILLVDDDPAAVQLVSIAMKEAAIPVTITHRESLADGMLMVLVEDFDAVLLDLGLPDSSGLETVESLCGSFPDLPVIVFTNADAEMGEEAMGAGAQDFITKSIFQEIDLPRAGYVIAKVLRNSIRRHSVRQIMAEEAAREASLRARVDEHTRVLVEALAEARTELRRSTEALDDAAQ